MTKKQRLDLILDIIQKHEIDTQEELTVKLNDGGFNVSQATVSRDIKELNLIKVQGVKKKFKYAKAHDLKEKIPAKILELYKAVILSITPANNLVVIKTLAGNGSMAGMAVDAMNFPQIIGTVAGDDTLLVVTKNANDAEIIVKTLRSL